MKKRVAITGFGVVSPIGVGKEAFFSALETGRSGISRISRFDASAFEVQLGGEVNAPLPLCGPAASFVEKDPKVAFACAAFEEAFGQARINRLAEGTLLHLGTSLEIFDLRNVIVDGRYDFARAATDILSGQAASLQVPLDTAAQIISDMFGMPGRRLTNCSACAAGAQAIGHGFHAVRSGECGAAVCGGFDSMINPLGVGGFQLLGALSVDNERGSLACRPFDAARSGTVLGEGAAMVVMEPLEKAEAQGKTVLAEVAGYASSLDAHSLSAPDPEADGAVRSMTAALHDAGIAPEAVSHINAHGTGTMLNDALEAKAIRKVFAETWRHIPVSATKSVTGHMIGAAGAVEIGACLFALNRNLVPHNPALDKAGIDCELNHVTGEARPFEKDVVLSNSFGFGGQNATIILRRYHGQD